MNNLSRYPSALSPRLLSPITIMDRARISTVKGQTRTTSLRLHVDEKPLPPPVIFEQTRSENRDDEAQISHESTQKNMKDGPVTWMSLPRKDQLTILFLCRLVDFLQVASLQVYVFYQLKSFDDSLSDAQISSQAGLLQGAFTGAQVLTAFLWGRAADASWCGRKFVLIIGLFGTAISCVGYGIASSFWVAVFWRAVGGGINGTVGIM